MDRTVTKACSKLGCVPKREWQGNLSYNQEMNPQQKSAEAFFRPNDRAPNAMRPVRLTPHYTSMAEGSVLIEVGHTRVLCNATVETGVPGWLKNSGRGWVTAEYGMLPRATLTRSPRESERGKVGGGRMRSSASLDARCARWSTCRRWANAR